jgi:hypothetical protein
MASDLDPDQLLACLADHVHRTGEGSKLWMVRKISIGCLES